MTRFIACLLLTCTTLIASASEFQFYSSRSQSSSSARLTSGGLALELVRTPLSDALNLMSSTYGVDVLVDADAYRRLQTPVSARGNDLNLSRAMEMIVQPAGVSCLVDATHGVIVTGRPVRAHEISSLRLISVRKLAIHAALEKRVPLMLFHTPLEMGLQMIEGFAGITVQVDRTALRNAGIDLFQPVTLQDNQQTLGESLDALLKPLGLVYVLNDTGIVITAKRNDRT